MTLYRCLVISAEGGKDWRTVDAPSESHAATRLIAEGFTPLDVQSGEANLWTRLNQPVNFRRRLGVNEQALLLNQLALLVQSGLPVDRSLDLLKEQSPSARQKNVIGVVLAKVRAGTGLAAALEDQAVFPLYVVGVIRSAERSGQLGQALASLALRVGTAAATRRQLITALTYPAAVLASTILALLIVLLLVVPQFAPIFSGGEAKLPALTRAVLWLSGIATEHGATLAIVMALLLLISILAWRSKAGAVLVQGWRHRLPGIKLRDQYLAAQFTGILSTLLGNGVTIVTALPLAREAIGSERWRHSLRGVERSVREGASLSQALDRDTLVPHTAIRLLQVGERSGQLARTCGQASTILGDAASARIGRIVSLVNPIAIITLGGIVALLIAGVMLGIFAMGDFAA